MPCIVSTASLQMSCFVQGPKIQSYSVYYHILQRKHQILTFWKLEPVNVWGVFFLKKMTTKTIPGKQLLAAYYGHASFFINSCECNG